MLSATESTDVFIGITIQWESVYQSSLVNGSDAESIKQYKEWTNVIFFPSLHLKLDW